MNFSKQVTVDGTGGLILEFDCKDLDALIIIPDSNIYIGFGDITQAVMPIIALTGFSMSNRDFRQVRRKSSVLRLYAKSAGASSIISISFLGENLL